MFVNDVNIMNADKIEAEEVLDMTQSEDDKCHTGIYIVVAIFGEKKYQLNTFKPDENAEHDKSGASRALNYKGMLQAKIEGMK